MTAVTELRAEAIGAVGRSLLIYPKSVGTAREFTECFLTAKAKLEGSHVDDVVLVVSELVTNSIKYGGDGRRYVYLEIGLWSKWTLIIVDDRTREIRESAPAADDEDLRESGRGLEIVEALAERFWWHQKLHSKTANAVILRTDAKLPDEDDAILDRLEKDG